MARSPARLHVQWVTPVPCVSEPFERNNVARAVHEKIKFEAIKAQFVEVHASHDNYAPFIFSFFLQVAVGQLWVIHNPPASRLSISVQSSRILQQRKDLNSILPVRTIINKESSRRWGIPLIRRADGSLLPQDRPVPRNKERPLGCAERRVLLPLHLTARATIGLWMLQLTRPQTGLYVLWQYVLKILNSLSNALRSLPIFCNYCNNRLKQLFVWLHERALKW